MSDQQEEIKKKKPKSTVENLQLSREQRKELEKLGAENLEEYKKALNIVAGSQAGKYFLKCLIKALKPFDPINIKGDVDAVVQRNVYLEKIRPYLNDDIRKELE